MSTCACCSSCGTTAPLPAVACGLCGSKDFTTVAQVNAMGSLIAGLNPVVDCLRDLFTQLGARAYQISLVWTRWTGGDRGIGNEFLVRELALLPTPLVGGLDSSIRQQLTSIGIQEAGNLRVSELSPSLNEDLLMGRAVVLPLGADIPDDMSFYWEIFFPQVGANGVRRRFTPSGPPNKNPLNFEWTITLLRASDDRGRDGALP